MNKVKKFEISVVDRTYSRIVSNLVKFYSSDSALEVIFILAEKGYEFDSAELVLSNTDGSLITRPLSKVPEGYSYEFEKNIISHYGEWKGQVILTSGNDTYVSSKIVIKIEDDLLGTRPPKLTDVYSWTSLKRYADGLVDDLKQAVLSVEGIEDTFNGNETVRTETFNANETTRQENENARIEAEKQREGTVAKIENRQTFVENQLNDINQELTTKDIISAPEIIAARNGEANLSERLDKEHQEVTEQLAHKPNYDTVWSMANMGQDIKEAWTDGAVAVVGVNGVQKINLTESAVGVEKLDIIASDLIGLDKVHLDWVLGGIQLGSINELSKNAVSSNNFIVLDKPITIELLSLNYVYNVFYYDLDGIYKGVDSWGENKRTIPITSNRKIRISVRYSDSRLIEDIYPLINNISIIKQHTSLKNVNDKTQQLDTRQGKVIQQLVGLEKQDYGWEIGRIQLGQFNPASRNAVTSDFITLDDEVKLSLTNPDEFKFGIANYTSDGIYMSFGGWRTDELVIRPELNKKIRVSISYNDDRLLSDPYPLLEVFTILRERERVNTDIPTYWESHLDSKISTIKNHQQNVGWNGTSFAFITDIHWNSNAQNSPMLLKKVVSECDIPYVLDGGDFCANPSGVSKQEQLDEISEYRQAFSSLDGRILRTLGNHDDNSINKLFSETIIDTELYDAVYRQNSKYSEIVSGKTGKYHYIDDAMHKVRYITLDALDIPYVETANDGLQYGGMTDWAFRQEQINWFTNTALNVPNNEWGVVVVSHIPINYGYIKNDNLVMNALQAFKDKTTYSNSANGGTDFEANVSVDYSNGGGEVYCWLAGHVHLDMTVTLPPNITFLQILTLNDNLHSKPEAPDRIVGTTTEQAFDVITIDKVNRKLLFTRIGAGSDRVFDY